MSEKKFIKNNKILVLMFAIFIVFLSPIVSANSINVITTFGNDNSQMTFTLYPEKPVDNVYISLPIGIKIISANLEIVNKGENSSISIDVGEDGVLNFNGMLLKNNSKIFGFKDDIQKYVNTVTSCNCPGCSLVLKSGKAFCNIRIKISSKNLTKVILQNLQIEYKVFDSDQDGVPDYMDKCPDTPVSINVYQPSKSSCTIFDNEINPETGCPNEPVSFTILNPEGYVGNPIDVEQKCNCLTTEECKSINIKFYVDDKDATPEQGCNAYFGTPTWEGDCELSIPSNLQGNKNYDIYADFYLNGIHYRYLITNQYYIKSVPISKFTDVGYCHHGWYFTKPAISTNLNEFCKQVGGIYYCKPSEYSIDGISTIKQICSDGVVHEVTPSIISWIFKDSNFLLEKTNSYAGNFIPHEFLSYEGRNNLLNKLNEGILHNSACVHGSNKLPNIYKFSFKDAGSVFNIYVDLLHSFCDSPIFYICPTSKKWCNIGHMTNHWRGFVNIDKYTVEIIKPKANFVSEPMGYTKEHPAMLMPNQNSISFEYKVKNTGYGDIKITVEPDCSSEIKEYCSVTPSTLILSPGQTGIILVKLKKPKPSVKVKNRIQEVGVLIKYTDAYGVYTSKDGYPKTLMDPVPVFVDTQPPTTTINPNGNSWTSSDVNYKLTCNDIYSSGFYTGCNATYYYVGTDLNTASYSGTINTVTCPVSISAYSVNYYPTPVGIGYTYGTVSCPVGHVCEKQVCFFSVDSAGNVETTKKSKIFYIDKQKPFIYTNLFTQRTLLSGSVFPVVVSCNDGLGSGCKKTILDLYYAGLTFTCNLNGNGKNICDFTVPDNTGCYYASATYDLKGIDNVGNVNETTGVVWIKKRSGCPCTSNQECFSGECVNGYCVGSNDNVSNTGITSAVKGSFIGIPTSYLKIKMNLGEKLQIPLTIQNPNDLPDTIQIKINAKVPWKYWIYFSNKQFSSNPRELQVYLLPHQKTSVPIIILGNQITNTPINISIMAKSLTYNVKSQTITLKLSVVENKAGVSSSKSAPGLEWYFLPLLALISSFIFMKFEW